MALYTEPLGTPVSVAGPSILATLAARNQLVQTNALNQAASAESLARAKAAIANYIAGQNKYWQEDEYRRAALGREDIKLREAGELARARQATNALLNVGRLTEAARRRTEASEQKELDRKAKLAIAQATIGERATRGGDADLRRSVVDWESRVGPMAASNVDPDTFKLVISMAPPGTDPRLIESFGRVYTLNMAERQRLYDAAQQTADGLNAILAREVEQDKQVSGPKHDPKLIVDRHQKTYKSHLAPSSTVRFDNQQMKWTVNPAKVTMPAYVPPAPALAQAQRQGVAAVGSEAIPPPPASGGRRILRASRDPSGKIVLN